MSQATAKPWASLKTEQTDEVEALLRKEFPGTDAYRYNSASIRVRVIDKRFEGKSDQERDSMVEPFLERLPIEIQADIMNLLTLAPGEEKAPLRKSLANLEFEEPSPTSL